MTNTLRHFKQIISAEASATFALSLPKAVVEIVCQEEIDVTRLVYENTVCHLIHQCAQFMVELLLS